MECADQSCVHHNAPQRVKRVRYNEDEPDVDAEDGRTAYEKSLAAKTTLVESFGARRNLQAIQAAQRNRVDAEALSAMSKTITSRCALSGSCRVCVCPRGQAPAGWFGVSLPVFDSFRRIPLHHL